MCLIAGTLLIHSVAEEAFWLLSGLVNTALKEYYVKEPYKRFTENQLRKEFGFTGVPIEVYFRQK